MKEDFPRTLLELEGRFSSVEACRRYLEKLRWPTGFQCPLCAGLQARPMGGGLWLCCGCRHQVSVTAGTIFQDSHLPLTVWFRAMWHVIEQKNGLSALGMQRALGLGSYRTAWTLLHKLRRAMVRPGRERLRGCVEVDETYWGSPEAGLHGRQTQKEMLIVIAAQEDGAGIGRIRLHQIPTASGKHLHEFIHGAVEPGSVVRTDGLHAYLGLKNYEHQRVVLRGKTELLPRVHRVASLLKRWLLGTHQGAVRREQLDAYLDEFTFRFNRRKSASRGKLFFRLAQQAVAVEPQPLAKIRGTATD
jgi:transposase-like protein